MRVWVRAIEVEGTEEEEGVQEVLKQWTCILEWEHRGACVTIMWAVMLSLGYFRMRHLVRPWRHGPLPRGLWLETHTWETSAAGGGQTTGADEITWARQVEKEAVDSAGVLKLVRVTQHLRWARSLYRTDGVQEGLVEDSSEGRGSPSQVPQRGWEGPWIWHRTGEWHLF